MRFIAVVAAIALSGGVANAADRHVDIVNNTGLTMTHFYASSVGSNSWEEDILGKDTLDEGETFSVNIDDGSGACKFDFKAVFEGGASLVKKGINVCTVGQFTYSR